MLCEMFKIVLLVSILGTMSYACKRYAYGMEIEKSQNLYYKYRKEAGPDAGLEALAICVNRIVHRIPRNQTTVFWQPEVMEQKILLNSYLTRINKEVVLRDYRSPRTRLSDQKYAKNLVVFRHDPRSFNETGNIFDHHDYDDKSEIVICFSVFSWSEDLLLQVSEYLWKIKVANALFVVYDSGEDNVKIYGYQPFSEGGCTPTAVKLLANDCNNENFAGTNVFMRRIRNMHKCPITAGIMSIGNAVVVYNEGDVIKVKGYEGMLFNTLAEVLNFTPVILPELETLWGAETPNGSWTGIHGQVQNGDADVGFGTMRPAQLEFEKYTVPVSSVSVVWILPNIPPVHLNKLILPLEPSVWLYLVVTIIVALIFAVLDAAYSKIHPRLLLLWGMFLGQSVPTERENCATKIFIAVWIFYSYIITNAYLGGLISHMTAAIEPKNIETTRELLDLGFPFGGTIGSKNFYDNPDDPVDYEIFKRFETIEYSEVRAKMLRVMTGETEFVLVTTEVDASHENNGNFHIMKERVLDYPAVFVVSHDSPYLAEFNIQMSRLKEAGFIQLWMNRCSNTEKKMSGSREKSVLRMVHVSSIFLLWLIGMSVSGIVFACEGLHNWHKSRKLVTIASHGHHREIRRIVPNIRLYRRY